MRFSSFTTPIHALVVGASGGIGLALVRGILEDRATARVFATARAPAANPALQELVEAEETRLQTVALDTADEDSVANAAESISAATKRIDLLVYCAGVLHDERGMHPERRLADVEPANLMRSFAVNAVGPLLIAKHCQHLLSRSDRCVLANLSARVGSIGDNRLGGWYAYRSSKAAQNMITRNLSIELRRRCRAIICVALHPGTVDTQLSKPFQANVPDGKLFTPERAANQLLTVIDGLTPESNGRFYAWDGAEIPW